MTLDDREQRELMRMLWAIADSHGGLIYIDQRSLAMAGSSQAVLEMKEDPANRRTIIRASFQKPKSTDLPITADPR